MSAFFIRRPIVAIVIAVLTVLIGLVCMIALPVAQYLRVIMLMSAVALGAWIFRSFSRPVAEEVLSD